MNALTPLGLILPDELGDEDQWGDHTNQNWTLVDQLVTALKGADLLRVLKSGDTMSGPLILSGDPAAALAATTKQYTDAADALRILKAGDTITGQLLVPAPGSASAVVPRSYVDSNVATAVPLAGGTMTGPLILSGDAVVQLLQATPKQYTDAGDALRVLKSGDVMSGPLVLSGDPTLALGATTKQYADAGAALRVAKAGDSMSGPLLLSADPTSAAGAATKNYVDLGIATTVPLAQRGTVNGVATLDASGKVPVAQLPAISTGTVNYKGVWIPPPSNTPVLASGAKVGGSTAPRGDYYVASTGAASFTAIDGISSVNSGDWLVSNGTIWERTVASGAPYVLLSGATMTGPLLLSGDPTAPLGAATKQFAETADALRVAKAGDTMTGPLSLSGAPSAALHAVTKGYADSGDALRVAKAGDTMSGLLVLSGPPVVALGAATKGYTDTATTQVYNPKGAWNATTNVPPLSSGGGGGAKGDVYTVTVAGSTALDGISSWALGDQAQNTGTAWVKLPGALGAMAFQQPSAVAITGGTAALSSLTILTGAGSLFAGDLRLAASPIAHGWTDSTGALGAYIQVDGTWQMPAIAIKTATLTTLTATTGTIGTLAATTANLTAANVTTLSAAGGSPNLDALTVKFAGVLQNDSRSSGIAAAWSDAAGNYAGAIQTDGTFVFGKATVTTLAATNLTAANFTPSGPLTAPSIVFGTSSMLAADRRNRYAEAWTDSVDNGALMLTSTGSLAFSPASGVLAKHLQSRVERSHVLTQGPPSHSDSVNTAGVANTTHHLCCTLDTVGYEAIRLVIPSMNTPAGATLTACIATSASATDKLNPVDASGNPVAWKPVSFASNGAAVDWEDQPYGSVTLTTTPVFTPQGTNVLTFVATTGVSVGMVCYIPAYATGAAGIPLSDHWARVTAVTPTTVTLSKNIQNMWNAAGTGNNGLPASWPCFFSPEKFVVPAWPGNAQGSQVSLLVSDWIPLSSLARSDGGRWPILMVRIYAANAGFTTLVTDLSQSDWSGYAKDRLWKCYTQTGDFVGTQTGFTNTTDNGTMALGWVQYYSRSRGATIMFSGDSITQGINTGSIEGFGAMQLVASQLSTPAVPLTAVGMVNGWNGCGIGEAIYVTSLAHLDIFKPQVLAQCTWTRNGEFNVPPSDFPAYAQECADWYFQQSLRLAQKAMRRYRTQILYFPMGPSNASALTAATEQVRLTGIVRARQAGLSGEMYLDQDVLLGTGSTPINDTYYTGLHPPAPAQVILSLDVARQLKSALGIG